MGSLDTCDTTFDFSRSHARLRGNVRNGCSCHICPIEEKAGRSWMSFSEF